MFYDHPDLARAYLRRPRPDDPAALVGAGPTYWIYHELWRLCTQPEARGERLRVILRGKDAIFDWSDPLPFLLVHHLQIPWLLLGNLRAAQGLDPDRLQHRQARRAGGD